MQLKQMTFALKVVMKFQVTFQGFFFCINRTQLCHGICHFISLENNSQWQSVLTALRRETSKFQSPFQNSPIHDECQTRSGFLKKSHNDRATLLLFNFISFLQIPTILLYDQKKFICLRISCQSTSWH